MPKKVDKVNQIVAAAAAPGHEADAALVVERLHALMHHLRRRLQQAAQAEGDGLAAMEVRALGFFARHPGSSAKALAAHSGRDKAQVARLLQPLLARGLLTAAPDASDRRSLRLQPTASGLRIERRMAARCRQIHDELLAGFSAVELQTLADSLARMLAAADEG
jgi:DNA-binding MarR family transcriptional regulator